jgi:hypothetical protein
MSGSKWGRSTRSRLRHMSGHDWATVAQYSDYLSALVVSKRLTDEGVPNRVWTPPRTGEAYIWVPPEFADTAKRILAEPAVSEAKLTALALEDSPRDDFETREPEGRPLFSDSPASNTLVVIAILVIGLLAALLLHAPEIASYEIARQRSPDGIADAVIIEIPRDAAGAHSYKVCLEGAGQVQVAARCREVAYLAGVHAEGVSYPVSLIWTASRQLEIRYANATSVHIYKPVVDWGSMRPAILIRAVRTGKGASDVHSQ